MKNVLILLSLIPIFISCTTEHTSYENIDWQGHRGARGVYPENTWAAFQYAIDQNMTTLEMDVVITKDEEVVLSHEPFLNHKICLDSAGNPISEAEEKNWNIYQMTYNELQKFDCGSIPNPDFPHQKPVSSPKPLLYDIIKKTIAYCEKEGKELPHMNVEIKYEDGMQNVYHPDIRKFNNLVFKVLFMEYPKDKWNIQSFDFDVLKHFHKTYPKVPLAALVYESGAWEKQFEELGFIPEIYSPYHHLVDKKMVTALHEKGVKIIPWTVNEEKDASRLLKIGVDGIITDYPDLADKFRNNP
ncbi:glycerophosphodiester phosphodiesterase family protein [Marivirga sp.]|uniref:glycerophosphodiester phosphodiesterase family protein n=1 Tax=Marivirga sp. TaxID=2018662 RepID=UPI002D7FE721|nr:glycerophosphodiester phosphodiesterase family protein [Marivirga sp.]HET8860500.1 glycerophosphodiester phosphodiesterase family protein [Marivirga sp.]